MKREFIKGNDAVAKAALLAGCTQYYGYPITPSSEIVHTCALLFPQVGATFLQAESEVAAINMVYGAAGAGKRVMTASSSPGISLKQEGVSYIAAAELPAVIIDVQRAGPGLGNIWPEQADYNQVVKGGGHGNYKCPVVAPNSPQEMCDLTIHAFELADKYLTPVYVLTDAYTGQVMEGVEFPSEVKEVKKHDWAVYADKESKGNLICSIQMDVESMERINIKLQDKYAEIEENEVMYNEYMMDDAEIVLVAYGITSRITRSAVDALRAKGVKAGLFRPITVFPYPKKQIEALTVGDTAKIFVAIEMSNGQMVDDVRLVVNGRKPVEFYGRMGGAIPTQDELVEVITGFAKKHIS
ncbi:MAG: 3-methyl-2-oxobutanoate dehydrogenase subunit VorB [Bacteriovoracaceae bacterium]|nr:3-methyl-2-oxobutanoate dehydrogenase subunit VorB [Bacteriovoracaceae bacterium]